MRDGIPRGWQAPEQVGRTKKKAIEEEEEHGSPPFQLPPGGSEKAADQPGSTRGQEENPQPSRNPSRALFHSFPSSLRTRVTFHTS